MKVAIDPGHGFANREPGRLDAGAIYGGVRECDVTLLYGVALRDELADRGIGCYMTRRTNVAPTPLVQRALRARAEGCTVMVSFHCNASKDGSEPPNGTETCYRVPEHALAQGLQAAVVASLGLRDRGIKSRDELAVLKGGVPAALIELGFLSNPGDRLRMTAPDRPPRVAAAIADALIEWSQRS